MKMVLPLRNFNFFDSKSEEYEHALVLEKK